MSIPTIQITALARATRLELLRSPGVLLAALGTGCLLVALHELAAATFDGTPALAFELEISTVALLLTLVAGTAAVRAARPGRGLGSASEILVTPFSAIGYTLSRFLGIWSACGLLLLLLLPFGLLGGVVSGTLAALPPATPALAAVLGVLVACAQFAAVGLLLGAMLPQRAALVGLILILAIARTAVPDLLVGGGVPRVVTHLLPDPIRLEIGREVGAGQPIALTSVLLSWAAAGAHTAALLLATSGVLEWRARGSRAALG